MLVKLDPMHFIDRLGDATWGKKHPAYGEFMGAIRDAVFAVYEQDKVSDHSAVGLLPLVLRW